MGAVLYIDHIDELGCEEVDNVIVGLKRRAYIRGIKSMTHYNSAQVLQDILEFLTDAGYEPGILFDGDYKNLVLRTRNVSLLNDPDSAMVVLGYNMIGEGEQDLSNPVLGLLIKETESSLQQVETNKRPVPENPLPEEETSPGDGLFVSYTYPPTHDKYPSQTKQQGGLIKVFEIQETIKIEGLYQTDSPRDISNKFMKKVNSIEWEGGQPGTWMCMTVNHKQIDYNSTPGRYRFFFTFEFNPAGWQPEVVYIDPDTGKPPPDVSREGAPGGVETILYYRELDFGSELPILKGEEE